MKLSIANQQKKYSKKGIKLETDSKEESQRLYQQWNIGQFNFLLQRTENHFHNAKTSERRQLILESIKEDLPLLDDEVLLWLYQKAAKKHRQSCSSKYKNSGYQDTKSERSFQKIIEKIIKSDSKYRHLEVYPSSKYSKDLEANQKMTIGVLVPDFIVFGIKTRGFTSVSFEINGDAHVYKYGKDRQKEKNLESLGIATLPIPNEETKNYEYIKKSLDDWLKKRSGPLDRQIQRNKRKIWTKTVACQFTLGEIETLVATKFNLQLNLMKEAEELIKLHNCPRAIKREFKNQSLPPR